VSGFWAGAKGAVKKRRRPGELHEAKKDFEGIRAEEAGWEIRGGKTLGSGLSWRQYFLRSMQIRAEKKTGGTTGHSPRFEREHISVREGVDQDTLFKGS